MTEQLIQTVITCQPNHQNSKLRYLMDADGFQINGEFLVKELAICDLYTQQISLYRFRVGRFYKLSESSRKQVVWLRNNIHGLNFIDEPLDLPKEQLDILIKMLCVTAHSNNELIGYKGGRYEADLLMRAGFPHLGINIELLGCPRLDLLIDQNPKLINVMCGHHRPLKQKGVCVKVPHCPQMEVAYFMNYLIRMVSTNQSSGFYQTNDIYLRTQQAVCDKSEQCISQMPITSTTPIIQHPNIQNRQVQQKPTLQVKQRPSRTKRKSRIVETTIL